MLLCGCRDECAPGTSGITRYPDDHRDVGGGCTGSTDREKGWRAVWQRRRNGAGRESGAWRRSGEEKQSEEKERSGEREWHEEKEEGGKAERGEGVERGEQPKE
ncbi:hypothetical protein NDU88_004706 [Pleurodeles waltl]|uniref:Uncharacterized protein n=1 Tax=Pleurodeles waltl TaxID=8319 RepID=A0AAV7RJH6_PLEWA|nr:hypothetical protein NDU88_004706 [Pleurodeles waltl]